MKDIKNNLPEITLGIRKTLNLSQRELGDLLNLSRWTILRCENNQKSPRKSSIKKVLEFIRKNNLDLDFLKSAGLGCKTGFAKDTRLPKLNLKYSEELAELVGILLGDGEIMKDGTLRISFDPKKDKNFLHRRLFPLILGLLGNKIGFESDKRIAFYTIAFVRFLEEDCNLKPGSKFKNNWKIPGWCFEKEEYLSAVLRGLFDTDGYFGYCGGSLDLMYGRFSDRCTGLVNSIEKALIQLGFKPIVKHTKDGRYRIRIQNKKDIIKFFSIIGASNLRHVVRFLLWRIKRYEARIEIEGLENLVQMLNKLIKFDINDIQLPFLWNIKNKNFTNYIVIDEAFITGLEFRNLFKWDIITAALIERISDQKIAKQIGINARSVRKWREGKRTPSALSIYKLINIAEENNINLLDYKCD